ncbi:MAG: 30S ribosomal protein THX [Spirochaetales bacterium]|jgi:30S ribosomal protein S31|nr:30S ribosomal protein THX [Spirochaetales bacterium]
MGKGDIRTKKGKIYRGTYGNTRKKAKADYPAAAAVKKAPAAKPAAAKKK